MLAEGDAVQPFCANTAPFIVQVTGNCPECSPNEVQLPEALYATLLPLKQQPLLIDYRMVSCFGGTNSTVA